MIAASLVRFVRAAGIAGVVLAAAGGCRGPSPAPAPVAAPATAAAPLSKVHLLLRVGERRIYLIDDDPNTPIESFPVAVGRAGHETPTGSFEIEEMLEHPPFPVFDRNDRTKLLRVMPPGPANPLGVRWIGFMHDAAGTTGIHGTPNPELLGKAVSGGCVRMRNEDVVRIYERVRLGTPVIVEP